MAIQCPRCGGRMVFDIPHQYLQCTYCGTTMPVETYGQNNAAQYSSDTYNANLYTCRSCGAELVAPDEQTVAYCAYCGGEAFLNQKNTPMTRPQRIIPFRKSKDNAKTYFANSLKKKLYVPKELKSAEFLDTFHGIYLPYWNIDARVPDHEIMLTGTRSYTQGKYDYKEDYEIEADIGGTVSGLAYDASAAFDDTIANEIAPFERKDERSFSEGYLAGFYSDKPTASPELYYDEAGQVVIESVYKDVERGAGKVSVTRSESEEVRRSQIGMTDLRSSISLFPVWFLTWRRGDRVAYSVMNGQTGKMAMDIPVDKKKFFAVSVLAAAALFFLLTWLSGFIIPKTAAVISAVFLVISSFTLSGELKQIYIKENHVYDYGDTTSNVQKKRRKAGGGNVLGQVGKNVKLSNVLMIVIFCVCAFPSIIFSVLTGVVGSGKFMLLAALAVQLFLSIKTMARLRGIARKTAIIPAILAPLVLTAGVLIFASNPAADYWYYGTAIGCLIAMVANCLSAINYFNYLTTRPVPNFFRREGANNAAD
ncbi:MAG: hypothetical protein J5865_02100 [Lachnospiraceae bacterium]|nr:hypothetical protein [Lachnospiraceae bacterium]